MSVLLMVATIEDMREKKIHRWLLVNMLIAGLLGGIFACLEDTTYWLPLVGGLAIGGGFVGFSILSRGQMGLADGMIIAALGMLCGGRVCLLVVSIASLCMAIISVGVLITGKGTRNTSLPFVPALLLGFLITGWIA